jgi:hypothetical protein
MSIVQRRATQSQGTPNRLYLDFGEKGKLLLKMVEIKARGAAKAEFTNVNEHFAATNNAEFGLFQQNLFSARDDGLHATGLESLLCPRLRRKDDGPATGAPLFHYRWEHPSGTRGQ